MVKVITGEETDEELEEILEEYAARLAENGIGLNREQCRADMIERRGRLMAAKAGVPYLRPSTDEEMENSSRRYDGR